MTDIVIPIYVKTDKQIATTMRCLESVKRTNKPYRTIIVETASDFFRDYADIYLYERNKTNATRSFNRGFGLAESEKIVLLTNDVILQDGWLEALLNTFDIKDCGVATLGTTQFCHEREDKIEEGVWCSVAMFPKKYTPWDEHYVNSWDDTDMVMRIYLDGKKAYRNYSVIVDHLVGQTQYADEKHMENFFKNADYFMEKFKDYKDHRIYQVLTQGSVL